MMRSSITREKLKIWQLPSVRRVLGSHPLVWKNRASLNTRVSAVGSFLYCRYEANIGNNSGNFCRSSFCPEIWIPRIPRGKSTLYLIFVTFLPKNHEGSVLNLRFCVRVEEVGVHGVPQHTQYSSPLLVKIKFWLEKFVLIGTSSV